MDRANWPIIGCIVILVACYALPFVLLDPPPVEIVHCIKSRQISTAEYRCERWSDGRETLP